MSPLLIETMCLPPIHVMRAIVTHSDVIFERHENYQKRSFRNRFYIAGAQGKILCTIPLTKGKNQQTRITDVRIAYDNDWVTTLLRTIKSNYGSAPYFEFYYDSISKLLLQRVDSLWDLNNLLMRFITNQLSVNIRISSTSAYETHPIGKIDMRNRFTPNKTHSSIPTEYQQVFLSENGFLPDLSILDLLFCLGPESTILLKNA